MSIIVPTYQESENLPLLVPRIAAVMRPMRRPFEIVVVDDDSRDGTDLVTARLVGDGYPLRLVTRVGERGLSSAVIRGFHEATGSVLVCMDADLSHPPEALPALLMALEDGKTEFVIGSRYAPGGRTDASWGFLRWLNSKVATVLARPFTSVADPMAGFFAIRREVFERSDSLDPVGYKVALELVVKCRCSEIREVPIHFADRRFGRSKLNLREQAAYLRHIKRLADYKFGTFSRFFQFCTVGATGVVVDLAGFAALAALLPVTMARASAIWLAMTWNFFLNRRLTFNYAREGSVFRQYLRFVAACVLGGAVSWTVFMALFDWGGWLAERRFVAALAGIAVGTCVNFALSLLWVFLRPAIRAVASEKVDYEADRRTRSSQEHTTAE